MPLYSYKAVKPDGEAVEGDREAADEAALVRSLQARGPDPHPDPPRRGAAPDPRRAAEAGPQPEGDRHPDPGAGDPAGGRADSGPLAPDPGGADRGGAPGAGPGRPAAAGPRRGHLLRLPGAAGRPVPPSLRQHGPRRGGERGPGSGPGAPGGLSGAYRGAARDRHLGPGLPGHPAGGGGALGDHAAGLRGPPVRRPVRRHGGGPAPAHAHRGGGRGPLPQLLVGHARRGSP